MGIYNLSYNFYKLKNAVQVPLLLFLIFKKLHSIIP